MGIERTLFFLVCVSAVGVFDLFNSLLAGLLVLSAALFSATG